MAEFFATTLDAYLILGMIADDADDSLTADGRPATTPFAHARLARMLGGDAMIASAAQTRRLASLVHNAQRNLLAKAIRTVVTRMSEPPWIVFVSGSGEFLARAAWETVCGDATNAKSQTAVFSLAETFGPTVSSAACAYAVAVLAEELWQT
jgi:uncharacterized hydantoinase/oxoprolinase family protein